MNRMRTALMAGAVLLASAPALAQGLYIGASGGQSEMGVDIPPPTAFTFSGDDTAFKAFGGYRINTYLALEGFYVDFGEPDDGVLGIDATAYGAELVAIIPVGRRLELFGKGGVAVWDAEFTGPGGFSDNGLDLVYGGGLAINVTEWVALRGEWEFYQIETDVGGFNVDTELISAGIQFNF